MINARLQNAIDELRREGSCHVFVVMVVSPGEAMVLMVPHGAELEMTSNPLGTRSGTRLLADRDWGRITRPMLLTINEATLPDVRPVLKAVEARAP